MTQFLRRFFHYPWRFCYRLVCWINYLTSHERMWHMYAKGKAQGRKEALKEAPWVHSKQPVNMALDAQATDEMPVVVELLH